MGTGKNFSYLFQALNQSVNSKRLALAGGQEGPRKFCFGERSSLSVCGRCDVIESEIEGDEVDL